MRIRLVSVLVGNQEEALRFYTEVLGFEKKVDIPVGEFRWLTVVSPEEPDGAELVLEPNAHPASATFKEALYADGIPFTALEVEDVAAEYDRLTALGVEFRGEPADAGGTMVATFDDTCGNYIQLYQVTPQEE